jgi:hypothetical protein
VRSMRVAADAAGVLLVTGDTKVVDRGKGDQIFINTAGIGVIEHSQVVRPSEVRPGDTVILMLGSANTDPGEFGETADDFDVDREANRHLAFGDPLEFWRIALSLQPCLLGSLDTGLEGLQIVECIRRLGRPRGGTLVRCTKICPYQLSGSPWCSGGWISWRRNSSHG